MAAGSAGTSHLYGDAGPHAGSTLIPEGEDTSKRLGLKDTRQPLDTIDSSGRGGRDF